MIQLLFPHWRKQNTQIKEFVWVIAAIIAFIVALFFQELEPEQMGMIAMYVYFPLRFILGIVLHRLFVNSIVGTFRINYQTFDHDLRLLLKEKSIPINRKMNDEEYRYDFLGYNLTMSVQPYRIRQNGNKPPLATLVTFHQLNSSNQALVGQLTEAIDAMVKQRTRGSDDV